jgi:hypothetical protein
MKQRREVAAALSAAIIVGGLVAGTTGAAAATTSDPDDPVTSGCANGAYVVLQGTAFGGTANLWWSPSCQKNWLQYDVPDAQHEYGLILWGSSGDQAGFQTTTPGWTWTDMVPSPGAATMCINRTDLSGRNQQDGGCWTQAS